MSKGTTRRSVRIEDDLWDAAQEVAAEKGDHLSEVLREALRQYINESGDQMSRAVEIGYMCHRGHFQFKDDPDGDSCGTKIIGTIYVQPIEGAYPDMFEEALVESLTSHHRKMEEWRRS